MKKRYPGPLPFSYDDRNLFFGRDQEIDYLTTLIINNQITVLHGKSGYGKSSLINAGLIPTLLETFNCEIIRVRFYNYDKNNPLRPLDTFLKTIQQHLSGAPYLDGLLNDEHASAWRYFKKLQYGLLKKFPQDEEGVAVAAQLSYIIVIDQFEELFTYPKEAVIELAKEFQEILLHRIPEEYQQALKEGFRNRENLETYKDELSILDKDIPLKVIFSLRTERFNYLTHLVSYIPTLLNNTYKVRRMTPMQVREAIVQPALVSDEGFDSPPYTYVSDIVDELIDFLNGNAQGDEGKIEVFEMQIICQRLEELLVEYLAKKPVPPEQWPVLFKEDVILGSESIKDKRAPYAEIIKNYYKDCIETIATPVEQLSARYLIEFKLIDEVTNNRISLDNAFVKQIGVSETVLRHLIDKRMIRIEVNTVSGHSLEISHDSLVLPIRNAAMEMGELSEQLSTFYETAVMRESKSGKRARDIINDIILDESSEKSAAAAELTKEDFQMLRENPVITKKDSTNGANTIDAYGVKKIFQQTAQQSRAKAQASSTRGWVRRFVIASMVFVAVVIAFFFFAWLNKQRTNRLSALLFLSIADTIHNKDEALRLTDYIYQHNVLKATDSSIIKSKLLSLLQTQEVQSKLSYLDLSIGSSNLKREEIDLSPTGDFVVFNNKTNNGDDAYGTYFILNTFDKKVVRFDKILYAYFIPRSDVAVLAKASVDRDSLYSNSNKFTREAILFHCKTGHQDTILLARGQYLYPPSYSTPSRLNPFDSYRIQQTASGNFIIPIYSAESAGQALQQVEIRGSGIKKLLPSTGSISTSKDGTKFMTLQRTKQGTPQMVVYDSQGNRMETFPNFDFADFAGDGALLFGKKDTFTIRYPTGNEHAFVLNDQITYAYTNGNGAVAVIEGEKALYTIDVASGKRTIYTGQLVGIDFKHSTFLHRTTDAEQEPDTIWRRGFFDNGSSSYAVFSAGIQSTAYNDLTNTLLVYTNDNRLYLLDSAMHIRAGFQLTANDLFGFAEKGNRFFYVRNEALSFFDNNDKLVNLFDLNEARHWLQQFEERGKTSLPALKEKYDLRF